MDPRHVREIRARFLQRLYEKVGGSEGQFADFRELGTELGLTPEDTVKVLTYLKNEGLLRRGSGTEMCITHDGIKVAESQVVAEQASGGGQDGERRDGPWQPGSFRLFLSHHHSAKGFVAEVQRHLSSSAIDGFLAHVDIEPAREWVPQIEDALKTCDALAAFLTPEFHESKWTDQEVGWCLSREVLIIPMKQEGPDPYGFMGKYQALYGGGLSAETAASRIFEILGSSQLTAVRLANALVYGIEHSESLEDARRCVDLLTEVKHWTFDQVQPQDRSNFELLLRAMEEEGSIELNRNDSGKPVGIKRRGAARLTASGRISASGTVLRRGAASGGETSREVLAVVDTLSRRLGPNELVEGRDVLAELPQMDHDRVCVALRRLETLGHVKVWWDAHGGRTTVARCLITTTEEGRLYLRENG